MDAIASLSPPGGTTFVGLSGRPVHITSPFRLVPHLAKAVHRQVVALGDKPRVRKALTATAIGSGITLSALYASTFRTAADGESSGKAPEAAVVKAMAFKWLDYPADYISPSMDVNAIDDFPLGVSSSAYVSPKYSESELALAFIKFRHSIKVPHDTKFVFDFRGFGTGFAIVTALGVIVGLSITVRARRAAGLVSPGDAKVSCGLSQGGSSPGFALNIPLVNVDGSLTVHADLAIFDPRVDISCTQRPDLVMAPVNGYTSVVLPLTGKIVENSLTTLDKRSPSDRNIFCNIGVSIVKYIGALLAFLIWAAFQFMAYLVTGRAHVRRTYVLTYLFGKTSSSKVESSSLPTPIEAFAAVDDGREMEGDHSSDKVQSENEEANEGNAFVDHIASPYDDVPLFEPSISSPVVVTPTELEDEEFEEFSDASEDFENNPSDDTIFLTTASVDTPLVVVSDSEDTEIASLASTSVVSSCSADIVAALMETPSPVDRLKAVILARDVKGKFAERRPSTPDISTVDCSTPTVSADRPISSLTRAPPASGSSVSVQDRLLPSSPAAIVEDPIDAHIRSVIERALATTSSTSHLDPSIFVPRPPAAPVTMAEPRRRRRRHNRGRNRGRAQQEDGEDTRSEAGPSGEQGISA